MDAVVWLHRGLGDGPSLLHPGRGTAWWATGTGLAYSDGARLWIEHEGRVAVVPLLGRPDVWALEDRGLLAWDRNDEWIRFDGRDVTHIHGRGLRDGADLRAIHRGARWQVHAGGSELDIPEGAADATDLRPWATGRGLLWASDGFLYRWDTQRISAIGAIGRSAAWGVGPGGSVLIGDGERWAFGGAARRSVVALATPLLVEPWGVRFSADGTRVAGLDADGAAVTLGLGDGKVLEHAPGALPIDADGSGIVGDELFHGEATAFRGLGERTWALSGERLAGPGGVVWDLASGKALFTEPIVRLGATASTGGDWLTIGWEDGHGVWFDPRSGAARAAFHIPIAHDDVVEEASAFRGIGFARTGLGRVFSIDGATVTKVHDFPETDDVPDCGDGWQLIDGGIRVDGTPTLRVPVEAAVRVGKRVWAWNTDGLLIAIPVG